MRLSLLLSASIGCYVNANQDLWLMGIQPFTGGVWDAGISMRIGAEIMLEEINKHSTLLPGYTLKVVWQNGLCVADTGKNLLLQNVFRDTYEAFAPDVEIADMDTDQDGTIETSDIEQYTQTWNSSVVTHSPVGLLTGCSAGTMLMVDIAYMARIPHISNAATRPALSDRATYPNFFRTILSDQFNTIAWVAMAKQLGQASITAVIGETNEWSTLGTSVADACETFGVTMVGNSMTSEIEGYYGTQITEDSFGLAGAAVEDLISFKVRSIILLLFAPRARMTLCQAETQGFVNAIWMVLGWFSSQWWQVLDTSCTLSQMNSQTHGMITANMQFWRTDTDTVLGCSETMTTAAFQTEWYGRQGKSVGDLTATEYGYSPALEATTTADAICMFAKMLHSLLVTENVPLDDLANREEAAYNRAFELLTASDFEAIQGHLTFDAGSADPKGYVLCQQVQNGAYIDFATFNDPNWNYFGVDLSFHFEGETISTTAGGTSITGNLASYRECPTGTVLNFTTNTCQGCAEHEEYLEATDSCLCVAGYYADDDGSCSPCAAGTFASSSGTLSCSPCAAGKYSEEGAASCTFCPLGTYASGEGMSACTACPGEYYTTQAIASESPADCICGMGSYESDSSTSPVTCAVCPSHSNTSTINAQAASACACEMGMYMSEDYSQCITCPEGSTTSDSGKVGVQNCLCDKGEYMPTDASGCLACPEGMTCPKGSNAANAAYLGQTEFTETQVFPEVAERFWASREDPMSIFECRSTARCPGGLPGRACAAGLEKQACEHCEEGSYWDGDKCSECTSVEASKFVYPVLPVLLVAPIMLLLYKFFGDKFHMWGSFQNAITAVAFITLNHYQVISILGGANLAIPNTVKDIYNSFTFTTDASSIFKVECSRLSDFQTSMMLKGVAPLVIVGISILLWGASRFFNKLTPQIPTLETNRWLNVLGSLLFTFFSAIAALSLLLFKCSGNPNGKKSLATDLSVVCFESDDWKSMLGLGVALVVVYIFGLGSMFIRAVFIAPQAFSDPDFQMRYKFLFIKFRAEAFWWALVFLAKNFFINLAMIVAIAGVAQLYLVMTVAVVYMLGCIWQMPYRARLANLIEVLTGISIVYAASLLTWFADRDDTNIDDQISAVTAVLSFYPLLAAVIGVGYLYRYGYRVPLTEAQTRQMEMAFQEMLEVSSAIVKLSPEQGANMIGRLQEWDRYYIMQGVHVTRVEVLGADSKWRITDKTLSSDVSGHLSSSNLETLVEGIPEAKKVEEVADNGAELVFVTRIDLV